MSGMMSRHTPAVRIARSQDSQDMHRDCPENVATLEPAARRGCHHHCSGAPHLHDKC